MPPACFLFVCFLVFVFPQDCLEVHGGSQTRGSVGPADAGLCHSNVGSEPGLQPTPQLTATPDP